MKIIPLGAPKVILSNPDGAHKYFAWPTIVRLQNGKLAVAASGFRLAHVCPFGKMVIAYSEDDGESYTPPAPVIDTPLDDRDGGIAVFGEHGVIVTSFNNSVAFQRRAAKGAAYRTAYLDTVTPEMEAAYLGSTYRISLDGGVTFGPIRRSPITSPHGPLDLGDGSLLWVGRTFDLSSGERDRIAAYRMTADGEMCFVGEIGKITDAGGDPVACEPHAIRLDDGRILAHIRVQREGEDEIYTVYQAESADGGANWSEPRPLLSRLGGSPPHLLRHSSGVLISTYGYREKPYGIRAMFSRDGGRSWETDHVLWAEGVSWDLGYPATAECRDGSLLTVFYARPAAGEPAVIFQQKWRFAD